MASRQSQAYSTPYPTNINPSQQRLDLGDDDVKSPYDDLIDQYATPYQKHADYKAYSVEPDATKLPHARRPSYPLSQKPSYTSEATGKDSSIGHTDATDWEYPPITMQQDKVKDKPKFWATVRRYPILGDLVTEAF